jgi:hypothetical protein
VSDDVTEPAEAEAPKPKKRSTNPKGRTPLKLTHEQIVAALRANAGMISRAARKLHVSNEALRSRIRKSERLQEERDQIRLEFIDLAEDNLVRVLQDPKHKDNFRASEFVLRTIGRDLGYGDQVDLNVGAGEKRVIVLPAKAALPGDDPAAAPPTPEAAPQG